MTKKWMVAVGSSLDLPVGRLAAPLHHPCLCLTLTLILALQVCLGFLPNILKDDDRIKKNAFVLVACLLTFNLYFPPRQTLLSFSLFFFFFFLLLRWGGALPLVLLVATIPYSGHVWLQVLKFVLVSKKENKENTFRYHIFKI